MGLHHGGAERVVANLCRYLDGDRFQLSVCWHIALGDIGEELRRDGFQLYGFNERYPDQGPYRRFRFVRELLKEGEFDIVHSHDVACLVDATKARVLTGVKHVHTFHFGNYPHLPARYLFLERVFSRFPTQLVAVATEQKRQLGQALRLDPSKIDVIGNGVAPPEPISSAAHGIETIVDADSPIIGSISTLTEQKGITNLLDSAAIVKRRYPQCRFVIVGDGPLLADLRRKSDDLGLSDTVQFVGWIPHASSKVLPSFDIFVQPSLWEANSMVLLEAMAAGKPIVATRVGESGHILHDGENGFLVEPGDPQAMAERITELIQHREIRNRFGCAARNQYESRHNVRVMTDRYAELYSSLL